MNINPIRTLETEQRNPCTNNIDSMSTLEILTVINEQDALIASAVQKCLPYLAEMVENICNRIMHGGHLYYIGAGTSGRLGVLDASECPPTYGVSSQMVQGIIAGGDSALRVSSEGTEDDPFQGQKDLIHFGLSKEDAVIGLAASGRTPYVIGALDYANSIGAYTGAVSCVSNAQISGHAQTAVEAITGPEVITGSTRMKAGTAQKMILNMISTSVMIKAGKVYQNLMVDVIPSNEKLIFRAAGIIQECTGRNQEQALKVLKTSQHSVKHAIFMEITGLTLEQAQKHLERANGRLQAALNHYWKSET
ncbi:MAG: N-acetylmuramic acid 6-phosphate etherase [Lachnospiraceae bacterium]|nr:N-acetylmuramic acid 6-phosphate etherase [Lachnospiraceae bacterium]